VEEEEAFSSAATIHKELSLTHTIQTTNKPLSCFLDNWRKHALALTSLTIKVNMTYEAAMVKVLCDKAQPHGCAFLGKTQRHADSSRLGAGSRVQP